MKVEITTYQKNNYEPDFYYLVKAESEKRRIVYTSDSEELYFGSHRLAYLAGADQVNAWIAQGKIND